MPAVDDDIRADFLVEAGDLIEKLGGQLVELESRPDDTDLLNAIFRAFHTVKGGAGFLGIGPLVELCHATEDVFNALRNGKRTVDAALMDAVLQAVDLVQAMMASVSAGDPPQAPPPELIEGLHALVSEEAPPVIVEIAKAPVSAAASDTISEDEFDALLDKLDADKKKAPRKPADTITEDEFDALLDQLDADKKNPAKPAKAADPNLITDDEFESLLDQMAIEKKAATSSPCPRDSGVRAGVRGAPPAGAVGSGKGPAPHPSSLPPSRGGEGAKQGGTAPVASAPPAETSVRVDTVKLDRMMNLVGELVLVRNRLKALAGAASSDVGRAVRELDFITRGLQGAVMQVRMQPIGKVFSRFPKLARDVARGLGKQVEVTLIGQDTDLDKNLVEALADPLVHMVRNSVDHGIEMPDVRVARGKSPAGQLKLEARQEGDHIRITVRDDGGGIDPERVRTKVVEKKLMDAAAAARLSHEECLQLIFLPGFSTKDQVSDLSGRGVGMDVVKQRIQSLNGTAMIESHPGQGSAVHLRVPLTLAILPALMIDAGERQFALPLAMVADVFALDPDAVRKVGHWPVIPLKRENLRLIDLEVWAGAADTTGTRHVVVVMLGEERYGLIVRQVRGREEVVIKPLGQTLRGLAGVAGATVTPQGRVALIVDVPGLVQTHAKGP
jgi:two-component system chemotaxis sensor kinase CheA